MHGTRVCRKVGISGVVESEAQQVFQPGVKTGIGESKFLVQNIITQKTQAHGNDLRSKLIDVDAFQ